MFERDGKDSFADLINQSQPIPGKAAIMKENSEGASLQMFPLWLVPL
jgi:hypothetical protein